MYRTLQTYSRQFKTLNNLNPEFMKRLFRPRETNRVQREKYKFILDIQKSNQLIFGTRNLCRGR